MSRRGKRIAGGRQRAGRPASTSNVKAPSTETSESLTPPDAGERLVDHWLGSRSGARAGRGFHFQDAVGAWLAALVACGELDADSVTPEGLEDVVLEGATSWQIQVKSRVEHLGDFSPSLASHHVLDAWARHKKRDDGSRLIVVLEHGVSGEPSLHSAEVCLEQALAQESALRTALVELAAKRNIKEPDVAEMMRSTTVFGRTWAELTVETSAAIRSLHALPPSALELIGRALRLSVADASDSNAVATHENRRTLTRTELVGTVAEIAAHLDLDALESAIVDGVCEPLDLSPTASEASDAFYEGTGTQPFHVASGLVVPRPDLVSEAVAGLADQGTVIITGPSGVGKSAVMWTVPLALPGVLWFRIRHLAEGDVAALIRLAHAYGASDIAPVGFLVDGAGTGRLLGWEHLRSEAAARPGILLLATARTEDLATLGDLSGCATVAVALDESSAEAIFEGLVRRGATATAHWREAFESSGGLTLEFTHILSRGQRLDDVIQEQVRRRIDEGRHEELDVLALVSTASRWSGMLSSSDVVEACSSSPFDLRKTIGRLADEHLLVERDGMMAGLHRLRSASISRAVHATPPPVLASTMSRTIPIVPNGLLHRFVVNAIRDEPSLSDAVIAAAEEESGDVARLIAFMHGLRLADFLDLITTWEDVADRHAVQNSSRPILFQFAIAGLTFPDIFPENLRRARDEMLPSSGTGRARSLADRLGSTALAHTLAACDSPQLGSHLMSTLASDGGAFVVAVKEHVDASSAFIQALRAAPVDQLAECLAAARACDGDLAAVLVDSVGGEDEVLRRVRDANPWITELDVRTVPTEAPDIDDAVVGYCRLLQVSEAELGDAREAAVAVGRTLLRCLPRIDRVDVQVLLPGGHEIVVGGHLHGASGLVRQYDHSALDVSWNQARVRAVVALLGATDTERLSAAVPLLDDAAVLLRDAAKLLLLGAKSGVAFDALSAMAAEVSERARALRPPLGGVEIGDTPLGEASSPTTLDDISNLATDVAENVLSRLSNPETYVALRAYIGETILGKHLPAVQGARWHLVGVSPYPSSLADLQQLLTDLHAVVSELSEDEGDRGRLLRNARAGGADGALARAADACRTADRRRRQARRDQLKSVVRVTGARTNVLGQPSPVSEVVTRWAITVEVASLAEWGETVTSIAEVLAAQRPAGESYVLIPLRNGRPVPSMAMTLTMSLLPATSIDDWLPHLNEAQPSSLADCFSNAQLALQAVSGICELPAQQRTHPRVAAALEKAASDYVVARKCLSRVRVDPLITELTSVLDRLDDFARMEFEGRSGGPGIAAQVVAGALGGDGGEVFGTIVGARLLALEWNIDPDGAVRIFETL